MKENNKPLPYKYTECKECKTKDKELFFMSNAMDDKDYFCKEHLDSEMQTRGKEA